MKPSCRQYIDSAEEELGQLEAITAKLRIHRASARPVLLVSLADALWRPERFTQAIDTFAPCLGGVDLTFVPTLGVDIFPENRFEHVEGSIRSYGQAKDPVQCCSFDVEASQCTEPPARRYKGLDMEQRARAEYLEHYLQASLNVLT